MATRRQILLAGALGALAPRAFAQSRQVKIGMLSARPLNESFYASRVVRRLAELGYREGAGMKLEFRSPSSFEEYPRLARDLGAQKCDLMLAIGTEYAAKYFREFAAATPAVFLAVDYDPVDKGIVSSFARPGGNITGVYIPQSGLAVKRMQIMSEIVPGVRRVLVFVDPFSTNQLAAVRQAAEGAGIRLKVIEFAREPYDFEGAFAEGIRDKAQGYIELASPMIAANARLIAQLLTKYRLPGAAASAEYVTLGQLLSYGVDAGKVASRTAELAVRILKGAKPGAIPVEQADEYELVLNAKTAAQLGVKVPERVLARATKIIN